MPDINQWATALGLLDSQYQAGRQIRQGWLDRQAEGTAADVYMNMQAQPTQTYATPQPGNPGGYSAALGIDNLSAPAPAPAPQASRGVPSFSDQNSQYAEMIRSSASKYGIDPDVALRVAALEGGTNGWIQSGIRKNGVREPSYGPFQMLVGGEGTGFPRGLGNALLDRGIDPRDPRNAQATIDYAMQHAAQNGWGAWYGAAKAGIGSRQGIGGRAVTSDLVDRGETRAMPTSALAGPIPNDRGVPAGVDPRSLVQPVGDTVGGIPVREPLPTTSGGSDTLMGGNTTPQSGGMPGYAPTPIPSVPSVIAAIPQLTKEQFQSLYRSENTRPLALAMWKARQSGTREDAIRAQELAFKVDDTSYDRASRERDFNALQGYRQQQLELSRVKEGPMSAAEEAQKIRIAQAGRAQSTVNVDTGGTSEFRKSLDKKEGDRWSAIQDASAAAAGNQSDLDLLDELSKSAPQGPLDGRLAQAFPGINSAADAFQSVISRVAPTLRAPGSGATSDIEYEGMVKSLPSLRNKPEANRAIISMMRAKANLSVQRGQIVSDYQNGVIKEDEARRQLDALNKVSIITPELRAALAGVRPDDAKTKAPAPGDVVDGWSFKGGDPSKRENWERQSL